MGKILNGFIDRSLPGLNQGTRPPLQDLRGGERLAIVVQGHGQSARVEDDDVDAELKFGGQPWSLIHLFDLATQTPGRVEGSCLSFLFHTVSFPFCCFAVQ